jgi:DNA-directed RNA polymerase subunit RPC12/RpoP
MKFICISCGKEFEEPGIQFFQYEDRMFEKLFCPKCGSFEILTTEEYYEPLNELKEYQYK